MPTAPNQAWTSDITYLWTDEGWLYLAIVLDLFNREVIGWSLKPRMTSDIVTDALTMAWFRRRPPTGVMHHSDRGSQYASNAFQSKLKEFGMVCSMSRKGNCWDNAPTESWFNSFKNERYHGIRYATHDAMKAASFEYIEVFYNRTRQHSTLGYRSPVQYLEDWMKKQNQENLAVNDAIFLSVSPTSWAEAIGKRAIEKDFERICYIAGCKNQQTCFSMFRHRFITLEVLAHLREWEQAKGPIVNEQDYRALLERVRIKTGHGSVESLFHYIDLARNLEGAWDAVDSKIEQRANSERLRIDISNIARNAKELSQTGSGDFESLQKIIVSIEAILRVD